MSGTRERVEFGSEGLEGKRVLLFYLPGLDFVTAFLRRTWEARTSPTTRRPAAASLPTGWARYG